MSKNPPKILTPKPTPQTVHQIVIEYNETTGQLQARIPENGIIAFGMLEAAKVTVMSRFLGTASQGNILLPGGRIPQG